MQEIIEKYKPLIHKLAYRYSHLVPQLSHEDLFQEGVIGLMDALETYDPNKGSTFMTWAYYKVMGGITSCKKFNRKTPYNLEKVQIDHEPFYLPEGKIEKVLNTFAKKPLHREIIKLKFGLFGYPEMTSKQIAKELKVSKTLVDSALYEFKKRVRVNCPDLLKYIV